MKSIPPIWSIQIPFNSVSFPIFPQFLQANFSGRLAPIHRESFFLLLPHSSNFLAFPRLPSFLKSTECQFVLAYFICDPVKNPSRWPPALPLKGEGMQEREKEDFGEGGGGAGIEGEWGFEFMPGGCAFLTGRMLEGRREVDESI
jgi:hypothetical protein